MPGQWWLKPGPVDYFSTIHITKYPMNTIYEKNVLAFVIINIKKHVFGIINKKTCFHILFTTGYNTNIAECIEDAP